MSLTDKIAGAVVLVLLAPILLLMAIDGGRAWAELVRELISEIRWPRGDG